MTEGVHLDHWIQAIIQIMVELTMTEAMIMTKGMMKLSTQSQKEVMVMTDKIGKMFVRLVGIIVPIDL